MDEYKKDDLIDSRYIVKDEIGGGGFGKVLSVLDQQNGDVIALKYCTSHSEEDIRRFKREVRIMENIDHENVIKVLYSNVDYNPPYFTMPMALYPVTKIISNLQGDITKVIAVFESICKGINAIHNSGHTHRDIKPDNALVFDGSKIVVSDLGLAKFDERDTTILTRASIYMGTFDYMPPEQMIYGGTRDLDHRGDVFQLGKTLYQLLTGHRPTVLNPDAVPIGIWYVIQKATRQNPNERYHSVDQLLDALHDAVRTTDPKMNPKGMFEELLTVAEENLKINEYDSNNISRLIQLIYSTDDMEDYITLFHRLPNRILQIYASNMATELEPIMEKYKRAIDEKVGNYAFTFAENVAGKMEIIFKNTSSPDVKKNALLSILIAGNRLNRWAAMGDFDRLLQIIDDDTVAYAVADGLREEIYDYKRLYDRIPKKELHPAIQVVWEACEREQNSNI
ncbi:serine/threonine-protein kinase [Sporosarcina sp. Marseille-Q4943]|uniref:serine/threonine-protein kinase n=1 Tax=Sporosarcina sp. Marseille-Q4943 TaxID=2942204 RepID=UPI00208DD1C3|nr:serine/threonine-protein kinase [Sporosarcina sp. Marseille-Q4943]